MIGKCSTPGNDQREEKYHDSEKNSFEAWQSAWVSASVWRPRVSPRTKPTFRSISKGFQHQFWQAVKAGSEQAAKDYKVKVTFEGPESETMVDKQIDMLSAALAKKPKALGFAALDSKAAIPLLKKAQAAKIPVVAFDSGVDSDIPVTTRNDRQPRCGGPCGRQDGRADRQVR